MMTDRKKEWIVYLSFSIWSDEADMLTVGHSGEGDYRQYVKQMSIVHASCFASKALACKAEKAAEKWLKDNGYPTQRVRYDKKHFGKKQPTRTNKWYLVPKGFLGPRGRVMKELIKLIQEDYND